MRKFEAIANLIFLGPMIGFVLACCSWALVSTAPRFFAMLTVSICIAAMMLILVAKISMFKTGVLVSFGSSGMSRGYRLCYRLGYALIVLGASLAVGILWESIVTARMTEVAQ